MGTKSILTSHNLENIVASPTAHDAHFSMSGLATATRALPAWAIDLRNPPAHKSKQAGIPDPPGFSSQSGSSSSKVSS